MLTRKNAFWVASIVVVIILAFHVLFSTRVTSYDPTDLGLLSKLPITFWIGLAFLGILLYLSRNSERRTIIVVLLITFFLFFIPVLVRENKAELPYISYGRSSQATFLLSEGRLDFEALHPLDLRNWPGFFFIAAFLEAVTGLPAMTFADYFPLLTIVLLGLITYSTLKLRLKPLHSALGALWLIGSFWTSQHYFSSSAISYVLFFAVFLLLAKFLFTKMKGIAFPLSIIVLFIGVVISHLLTSFIIVIGVTAVYVLYKTLSRKVKMVNLYSIVTCILIAFIFLYYQALFLQRSFSNIVELLYGEITRQETHISTIITQTRVVGSPNLQIEILSTYSITIINIIVALLAVSVVALYLLFRKKEARYDLFWVAWILVAGIVGISVKYGGEAINRAFMFMLIPVSYFAAKYLSKKPRIFVLILVIIITFNVSATFVDENRLYIPTSEFKGTAFYAKYAPQSAAFFYEYLAPPLPYAENTGPWINIQQIQSFNSLPSDELVSEAVGGAEFIIWSKLQANLYIYFFGIDLLEHYDFDQQNRVYDNGNMHIYAKNALD